VDFSAVGCVFVTAAAAGAGFAGASGDLAAGGAAPAVTRGFRVSIFFAESPLSIVRPLICTDD
jgi:hypothetical protein